MTTISPKVAASTLGGAIVTLVVAILAQYTSFHPDPAVVAAMGTIAAFTLGWLVPENLWRKAGPDESALADEPPAQPTDVSAAEVAAAPDPQPTSPVPPSATAPPTG